MSLRALHDAYLYINRVINDVDVGGLNAREDITVIIVVVMHGIVVLNQSLVHELLVVDVTFLHIQDLVENIRIIDGVAYPCDVANIVFLAFVDFDVNVDMLIVDRPDRVVFDSAIAEA